MPTAASFLSIDVGRNSLSLVLLGAGGEVVATLSRAYASEVQAAVDPQDWWRAARTAIKELLRRSHRSATSIRSIGVTGESGGFVALDKDGKALCPTVIGPDPRAEAYAEQLVRQVGPRNMLNLASGLPTSASTAAKLLWLRDHEKRVWHDLAHVLPPKDFLRFRLTDVLATDPSDATATLLYNPRSRSWSKQLITSLDIHAEWLPVVGAVGALAGRVTASAARETGLQAGTPVVTGAAHLAAAAIAVGAATPGTAMIELGGDGALLVPTTEAVRDPSARLGTGCHAIANLWTLVGSDFAGAQTLGWLMEQILPSEVQQARRLRREPLEALTELASEVPPGSDGLLFLPPALYPQIAGFVGLTNAHRRGHLVRSVLESGALAVRQALAALGDARQPSTYAVTGEHAGNTLWCQIVADALDQPVRATPCADANAIGVALLAGTAVGIYKSLDDARAKLSLGTTTYQPRKAAAGAYAALMPVLARLTASLRAGQPQPAPALMSAEASG